ncbi:MAG: rod shape-determining protein MreD [Gammaproteobacteria bacterium]
MKLSKPQGMGVVALSFVAALLLMIIPLPEWARLLRPEWVSLVLIYWVIALPHRIGLGVAWVMGLLLDVMRDSLLGQHALALVLITYIVIHIHQRLRLFPLWQQSIIIFMLLLLQTIIIFWMKGVIGEAPSFWYALLPALMSALFWSVVFVVLRHVRRLYQVK